MKILAVDDDPLILELLTEVLRAADFENVTVCGSANDALNIIEATTLSFDCILLDIQMPDVDGIQLLSAIRAMPTYANTPILMITAMSDRSYIDKAFQAGASDYITKPFEISEVHARLRVIEALVKERNWKSDRNPVAPRHEPLKMVTDADFQRRLRLHDIDGFIDYLALENYMMQLPRLSLLSMCTLGVVVRDMRRMFAASSVYEYESAVADVAEVISETLKPQHFFAAHAGEGEFACVIDNYSGLSPEAFERALNEALQEMDLHYCDGRPMSLQIAVGDPISLKVRSAKSLPNTLVQAMSNAELRARIGRAANKDTWRKFAFLSL